MNHRMISDLPPGIATVGVPVAGVGVMQTLMWPEFPNNTKEAIQQIGNNEFFHTKNKLNLRLI